MARRLYRIAGGVVLSASLAGGIVLLERRAGQGEAATGDASQTSTMSSTTASMPPERAVRFGQELARATAARDPKAIGALFRPDATISMVGRPSDRERLEQSFVKVFDEYGDVRFTIGRKWVCGDISIVEFVYSAIAGPRAMRLVDVNSSKPVHVAGMSFTGARVGVVGAFVLQFDEEGLVRTAIEYMDGTTYGGQLAPKLLPEWARVRPAVNDPPFGTGLFESKGTVEESRNIEAEKALVSAAARHDADGFVRLLPTNHVYDDYRTGGAMNNESLRSNMLAIFAAFPDWNIASTSLQCAAGDYVITQHEDSGTWQGQFLGRDPSNKSFRSSELFIQEFRSGVPVHTYSYGDSDGVLRQIGFWKDAGPASSDSTTARGRLVSPTSSAGH